MMITVDELPEALRRLPAGWTAENRAALEAAIPLVYEDLRRLARQQLRRERQNHTLQTTALVHEVYLRLVDQRNLRIEDRAHVLAVSARLMRFILVDHARRRGATRHGGDLRRVSLEDAEALSADPATSLIDLDAALERLTCRDARKAQVAEMRLFAGLTIDEIAQVLLVSPVTAARDWQFARAWLARELSGAR